MINHIVLALHHNGSFDHYLSAGRKRTLTKYNDEENKNSLLNVVYEEEEEGEVISAGQWGQVGWGI